MDVSTRSTARDFKGNRVKACWVPPRSTPSVSSGSKHRITDLGKEGCGELVRHHKGVA